jgi:hypothetical protein
VETPGQTWSKARLALIMTAQLLPIPAPAVRSEADGPGRVVVRLGFRSASPEVVVAVEADLHAFVAELFSGMGPPLPYLPVPAHYPGWELTFCAARSRSRSNLDLFIFPSPNALCRLDTGRLLSPTPLSPQPAIVLACADSGRSRLGAQRET